MACAIEDILDLDTYPLHQPDSFDHARLVATLQNDWRTNGAFRLPELIRGEMAARAAAELRQPMETVAFRHRREHNIYFIDDTDGIPSDIAERRLVASHRTLTCDQMAGTIIRSVYEWDPLRDFIQRVLDLPKLHRMADPMACLNVMAYGNGDQLGWHFDRAEFAVTILLQAPDEGGQFEYRRGLRTASCPNYDGVRQLLAGQDDQVRQAVPSPGTMTVFGGAGSAHRVAPVVGDVARMMAVLSYMDEPGYTYGPEDRKRFYGRTSPDERPPRRLAVEPA